MSQVNYPPFDVIREDWWSWRLQNGNTIKVKNVVISFQTIKIKGEKRSELGFKMKTIVGLIDIKTGHMHKQPVPKSKIWKGKSDKSVKLEDVNDYEIINNKNNYYEIYPNDNITLLVSIRTSSVRIQKSNKYTMDGDPVYFVSTQQNIALSTINDGLLDEVAMKSEQTEILIAEDVEEESNIEHK